MEQIMNKKKIEQIALSYLRSAAAVAAGLYMTGVTDPKTLASAFIAGIVGPALKALDPTAHEFGITKK
jgi:hypothetical protein